MEKRVLLIGAGLSGRGMLGELFYDDNFEICFADRNNDLVSGLRKQGFYHVKQTNLKTNQSKITRVEGFKIIDTRNQKDEYIDQICQHDLICTAIHADGFDEAISDLSEGIKERMKRGIENKMFITLGANYVMLEDYYRKGFEKTLNQAEKQYFNNHVFLVMSVVNRKNLKPVEKNEMIDKYTVVGDDKSVLRVEDITELRNYRPLPSFFRFEKDINRAMALKIWTGNVVQCSMAFTALGSNPQMRTSYQAAYDPLSSRIAYMAAREAYYGVHKEFSVETDEHEKAESAVKVFRNDEFSDDLYRIARQPIRKMGYNDRFIGPARMCIKHGQIPFFITKAMAYGLLMDIETDSDCKLIRKTIEEKGIREAVKWFTSLNEDDLQERIIIDLIVKHYQDLSQEGFE